MCMRLMNIHSIKCHILTIHHTSTALELQSNRIYYDKLLCTKFTVVTTSFINHFKALAMDSIVTLTCEPRVFAAKALLPQLNVTLAVFLDSPVCIYTVICFTSFHDFTDAD